MTRAYHHASNGTPGSDHGAIRMPNGPEGPATGVDFRRRNGQSATINFRAAFEALGTKYLAPGARSVAPRRYQLRRAKHFVLSSTGESCRYVPCASCSCTGEIAASTLGHTQRRRATRTYSPAPLLKRRRFCGANRSVASISGLRRRCHPGGEGECSPAMISGFTSRIKKMRRLVQLQLVASGARRLLECLCTTIGTRLAAVLPSDCLVRYVDSSRPAPMLNSKHLDRQPLADPARARVLTKRSGRHKRYAKHSGVNC